MIRITDKIEVYKKLKELIIENTIEFNDHRSLSNRYEVWNKIDIEILGKKRSEIYFVGIIVQSNYVGFYFMPIYVQTELSNVFSANLLKHLKGKSCFHIDYLDEELILDITKALEIGKKLYIERNWI